MRVLLLLLLAAPAHAELQNTTGWQPCSYVNSLRPEIMSKAQAYRFSQDGRGCIAYWDDLPGQSVSCIDYAAQRQMLLAELAQLENKLEEPMTAAEIRRAIKILLKLTRNSQEPGWGN